MKRIKIPDETRELIFDINNHECQDCGESEKRKLHIHHLNKDATDNNEENLWLCCYECHAYNYHPEKADEMIAWYEEKFENEELE